MFLNTLMVDMSYFNNNAFNNLNINGTPSMCAQDLATNKTVCVPTLVKARQARFREIWIINRLTD